MNVIGIAWQIGNERAQRTFILGVGDCGRVVKDAGVAGEGQHSGHAEDVDGLHADSPI